MPSALNPEVARDGPQASAQGSGALSQAEATERILLARMQSEVYEAVAASAPSQAHAWFGVRLPGLGQAAHSELRPGDFCLYEDVPGAGLPSAQERRSVIRGPPTPSTPESLP